MEGEEGIEGVVVKYLLTFFFDSISLKILIDIFKVKLSVLGDSTTMRLTMLIKNHRFIVCQTGHQVCHFKTQQSVSYYPIRCTHIL